MRTLSIRRLLLVTALVVVAGAGVPAGAQPAHPFPDEIALPDGFRPEGIAIGRGATFYAGSLANGALYRGDLRTGKGRVVFAGDGAPAAGLAVDRRERVWVAGGPSGKARLVDGRTGTLLQTWQLASAPTFVNDVVVAAGSAWFTDSQRPVLHRVPLDGSAPATVPLSGDYVHQAGFNLNGIEAAPGGRALLAVQSNAGLLFRIDPATGVATRIDAGDASFANGDGLLRAGRILYVVRNQNNLVVAVRLSKDLASATVVDAVTDPRFDVPTTLDRFGASLYVVNARFTTPPTPTTPYRIVRLDRR